MALSIVSQYSRPWVLETILGFLCASGVIERCCEDGFGEAICEIIEVCRPDFMHNYALRLF
jgi:hypothetical protein